MKTFFNIFLILLIFTASLYSQTLLKKDENNPVFIPTPGTWDAGGVGVGTVLFDGSEYKMWFYGHNGNFFLRIGHAVSPDGLTWSKPSSNHILPLGNPGSFDGGSVAVPSVMFDDGMYKMWYTGMETGPNSHWRIGYATSPDGINWTKHSGNPVFDLGTSGEWDDFQVGACTVIKEGSEYKMWYQGNRVFETDDIGLATSPDGINWTKYNDPSTTNAPFAESDPVLSGYPDDWDANAVRFPNVIVNNSSYEMWYVAQGNPPGLYQNMGYASSTNGINWERYNDPATTVPPYEFSDPVMISGSSGEFDDTYILTSSVIFDLNKDVYKMWYTGYGTSTNQWRIGYAESPVVPVELESFSAVTSGNNINLTWVTATELNNHGFELFRNGNKIAFVEGRGTTTEKQEYFYEDKNLKDGIYNYRLEQLDFDGTRSISSEVTIYLTIPKTFSLEQNYPNPFNPVTKIKYKIPDQVRNDNMRVQLKVYDLLGREVATLVDEFKPAGSYEVEFDASSLSSGTYFYRLQTGEYVETKKLILLR